MDLKTLANPFQFADLDIRTATDEHSEVWFCAKDVCAVLDIEWSSHTLDNMPENWFMMVKLTTIKGEREAYFINEAGLHYLIFRSNKPKAKDFASWVCETVLPEIRKTGFFGTISIKDQINISKQIESISLQIVNNKNAFRRKLLQDQLRRLCNIVNQPIPSDDWIAKDCNPIDPLDSQDKLTGADDDRRTRTAHPRPKRSSPRHQRRSRATDHHPDPDLLPTKRPDPTTGRNPALTSHKPGLKLGTPAPKPTPNPPPPKRQTK